MSMDYQKIHEELDRILKPLEKDPNAYKGMSIEEVLKLGKDKK